MNKKHETIIGNFMSNIGLLDNSLGKYGKDVLYSREEMIARNVLRLCYKKKDVNEFFPPFVDQEKYMQTLDRFFTFYQKENNVEQGDK